MQIEALKIKGTYHIHFEPRKDERGHFMRIYDQQTFEQHGLQVNWLQENHVYSAKKNTLRGLHMQVPPYAETKLLRCVSGAVLDVFVDLRESSPTFGQWDSVKISAEEQNMVYVPKGFAHGYLCLTDNTEVSYRVDSVYHPQSERAIRWDDPQLAIEWGVDEPIVSEKDQNAPSFQDFIDSSQTIKI
jgi:dTDP-4-dehydrorhamnose 3,5-epimerase